jgi:hypothetical protein
MSKHASLTTEALFSAWSVQIVYKEVFQQHRVKRRVEFWDTSLPGYEPGSRGIELSRFFVIGAAE